MNPAQTSRLSHVTALPHRYVTAFLLFFVMAVSLHAQEQEPLRIAAAADLEPVLPALQSIYEYKTGRRLVVSYQSSSALTTQILNGAPYHLFLAADLDFPKKVIAAGLSADSEPTPYARGTLVLWTRNDSPAAPPTLELLHSSKLHRLAVANPDHAPYGRAAVASLTSLHFYEENKPKFVTAENIAQTAQYAESGNAEAGLISLTSALSPRLKGEGKYIVMPRDSYPPILQGAIVTRFAVTHKNDEAARDFLKFLMTPEIRERLKKGGLTEP